MTGRGSEPPSSEANDHSREFLTVIAAWLALASGLIFLASQDVSVPGLYYDEAVFGGMAKDFLTGEVHGEHMPQHQVVSVLGRPFPVFIQGYLGALKSWLLIPIFGVFGSTVAVLRLANLGWSLVGLLIFMLWTHRWLGLDVALLAGPILALDPSYFFLSVLDWGSTIPSFLCRFAGFYLTLLWWRHRRIRYGFAAALFFGLGFFNKVDFAVLMIGVGVAAIVSWARPVWELFRTRPLLFALPCLGFVLSAGLMIANTSGVLSTAGGLRGPGELTEKFNMLLAVYDGSYFHRLMQVGGLFDKMYEAPSAAWSPFGLAAAVASVALAWSVLPGRSANHPWRAALFLLLATLLVSAGMILLPGAVRIHHAVLVFPFPHLIIATAAALAWRTFSRRSSPHRVGRALVCAAVVVVLLGQLLAIRKTQLLIGETGGRGRWSESFDAFCQEVRERADLTIVSLDWGFNEQLMFLTDGPRLVEPFWRFGGVPPALPKASNFVYLAHAPEYSLFHYDTAYLNRAWQMTEDTDVHPYYDRQRNVAFYAIWFRTPPSG